MGIIDDLSPNRRLNELAARVAHTHAKTQSRLKHDSDALHAEVAALRRDLEELALYTRALSSLLVEKGVLTQDELVGRLEKLDGEDGLVDGRLS
jgi:hypothetical protein